jgi:hypothetical protein
VTDKCQDSASQESGKKSTALEPQHSLQLTASHQEAMAMRSSCFSAFLSFICLLLFIPSISATCFYPDGSLPTDYSYTPCGNAAVEPCCTSYDDGLCVNGGLCKNDYDVYYIGACTDKTWGSSICPNYCKNGEWCYFCLDFIYVPDVEVVCVAAAGLIQHHLPLHTKRHY